MKTTSETTVENYCIECKQVARDDCEDRGHVVGTLGQTDRRDRDHCAFIHETIGMRCGGYRKGHEERYLDHPFMESRSAPTTQPVAGEREEWWAERGSYASDEYVIERETQDPHRDAAYTTTNVIARGMSKEVAQQIVRDHAAAGLVGEMVETLETIQSWVAGNTIAQPLARDIERLIGTTLESARKAGI